MGRQGLGGMLSDEQWTRMLKAGRTRVFEDGRPLIRQGEQDTTVFLLVEGAVKVTIVLGDGTQSLLAVRGPGSVLGERAALSGLSRGATVTPTTATCLTRVLTSGEFRLLIRSLELEQVLWQYLMMRQNESDSLRAEMAALPARQRLAATLLRLAQLMGESVTSVAPSPHRIVLLRLGLSQRDLGESIGLSRAAVAAEFARLRSRGVLRTGREFVAIHDLDGLRAVADGTA